MGQRLVITVRNNGKDLAKIYYHWSAYTVSALMEARNVITCIGEQDDKTEKDLQLRLIRFCEENGGGIDGSNDGAERKRVQAMFPDETFKTDDYSRNRGLIALSEEGMDDLQSWSEGDIDIVLDEDVILNGVYWSYCNFEEYKEHRSEWDDDFDSNMQLSDIQDIGYDLSEIYFDELDGVIDALTRVNEFVVRNENEIFELIA